MVPLYSVFRAFHMIGNLTPLWLPSWFGSAWNIFLIRQFFMGIPKDLLDAARIDGCNEWQIFWKIVLPIAKPVLVVVGLFSVIYNWNDFLAPLLYLTKQENYTLSLGLQFFQSKNGGTEWNLLMAASTLVMLPVLVLFMFGQRALVRGITMTGVKM
jgi:multiple sugar transport system permease protein